MVCLNGPGVVSSAARRDLEALGRSGGIGPAWIDLDRGTPLPDPLPGLAILHTTRAGKAIAWNVLRTRLRTDVVVFCDADVDVVPGTIARLLALLAGTPRAILASPKTICAPRPTAFEAIMAAPYAFDFPNLSGQLYAARTAGLPPDMPEDLIEPERWLELAIGSDKLVRDPAARVVVRLPGSLADFYRQRIRIEMGKVQLVRCHAALLDRGNAQPGWRHVLRGASPTALVRLACYLALRESAHVVARWRFGRRTTTEVWVQPETTKRWRD